MKTLLNQSKHKRLNRIRLKPIPLIKKNSTTLRLNFIYLKSLVFIIHVFLKNK